MAAALVTTKTRAVAGPRTMPDCVASDKSGDDDGVAEDGLMSSGV